ncbi:hypothetical protein [Streptomyces spinosirectus]
MIVIAVLVLPMLGAVLLLMDRVEDWMSGAPSVPRHAGARRHLSLISGEGRGAHAGPGTAPEGREHAA